MNNLFFSRESLQRVKGIVKRNVDTIPSKPVSVGISKEIADGILIVSMSREEVQEVLRTLSVDHAHLEGEVRLGESDLTVIATILLHIGGQL